MKGLSWPNIYDKYGIDKRAYPPQLDSRSSSILSGMPSAEIFTVSLSFCKHIKLHLASVTDLLGTWQLSKSVN